MTQIIITAPILNLTTKEKEILILLYRFRFLNTQQIQTLLNHKSHSRVSSWLNELLQESYVKRKFSRQTFQTSVSPAIYYLSPKARHTLASEKGIDLSELDYIYQEHRRKDVFINHCVLVADAYIYLLSQQEQSDKLKFFTKVDLKPYTYFPDPMPDAFFTIKSSDITRRYMLDVFDDYTPPFVFRERVKMYLEYVEKPDWEENTDATPFPKILFILPNESIKKHVYKFTHAILEKSYNDAFELFLTTKEKIRLRKIEKIWQKVE